MQTCFCSVKSGVGGSPGRSVPDDFPIPRQEKAAAFEQSGTVCEKANIRFRVKEKRTESHPTTDDGVGLA